MKKYLIISLLSIASLISAMDDRVIPVIDEMDVFSVEAVAEFLAQQTESLGVTALNILDSQTFQDIRRDIGNTAVDLMVYIDRQAAVVSDCMGRQLEAYRQAASKAQEAKNNAQREGEEREQETLVNPITESEIDARLQFPDISAEEKRLLLNLKALKAQVNNHQTVLQKAEDKD